MATDPARKQTDDLLKGLEKRIKKEYEQAAKELQEKADLYFQSFNKEFAKADRVKQMALKSGAITQQQYDQWRVQELTQGTRYKEMINDLTATAVNADKAAMGMVNDSMADVFSLNANYGAYEVEKATGIDTSFTLYNRDAVGRLLRENPNLLPKPSVDIPEDMRWNKQHMTSAILQGILQGDSIDNISKRLESVTTMDSKAAVRNARTMTTSAENAGHMISYIRAEEMGIKGKKMWMATHDNRTRESHAMLDGETRDLDEAFSNGLMEPGDMSVDKPEEVYNCRCRIVYVSNYSRFAGDYDEENQKITIDGKSYAAWKQESYEAWEKRHEKQLQDDDVISPKAQEIIDFADSWNIEYKEVSRLDIPLSEQEIIDKLAGGDQTRGSCASLSFAYAGNVCGYDVTDYRGGKSMDFFSRTRNIDKVASIEGVKSTFIKSTNDIKAATDLLKTMEMNKQYILSTGRHAAIVQRTERGLQYLEMQSARSNGWKNFDANTLRYRFGCQRSHSSYGQKLEFSNALIDVESMKEAKGFRQILGYLNTETEKQMKGKSGHER